MLLFSRLQASQFSCVVLLQQCVHKLLTIFFVCKFDVFFSKRARYVLNTASTLSSKGPTSLRWIWQLWPKNLTKLNECGWLKVVLTLKITGSFWRYYNRNCNYFVFLQNLNLVVIQSKRGLFYNHLVATVTQVTALFDTNGLFSISPVNPSLAVSVRVSLGHPHDRFCFKRE